MLRGVPASDRQMWIQRQSGLSSAGACLGVLFRSLNWMTVCRYAIHRKCAEPTCVSSGQGANGFVGMRKLLSSP